MTKVLQTVLASVAAVAAGAVVALVTYAVCPKLRAEINGVREYSWKGYSEIKKQQALVNKLEMEESEIRHLYGVDNEKYSRLSKQLEKESAKLELMKQQNRILV